VTCSFCKLQSCCHETEAEFLDDHSCVSPAETLFKARNAREGDDIHSLCACGILKHQRGSVLFVLGWSSHFPPWSHTVAPGLLQQARPNHQSLWFCFIKTIMAVPNRTEPDMSSCTIHYILPLLIENMDRVGFVENMTNHSLYCNTYCHRMSLANFKAKQDSAKENQTRNVEWNHYGVSTWKGTCSLRNVPLSEGQ
jgi:hypothetical protein